MGDAAWIHWAQRRPDLSLARTSEMANNAWFCRHSENACHGSYQHMSNYHCGAPQ
jgi:hypothetical protein